MKRENFFDGTEACPGYCRVVRVGPQVFVSGTTSADDKGHVVGDTVYAQTREIYRKMEKAMKPAGAGLGDIVRLVVYVTDMLRLRSVVNTVQEELWGEGPYPPRTIVEVRRLNQDDIVEVEGTFYAPIDRS